MPHTTKQRLADEQDAAAGGRQNRTVIGSEPALGRVILTVKHNRLYAELRWQVENTPKSIHLGEVTARTRAENLTAAWETVFTRGLARRHK